MRAPITATQSDAIAALEPLLDEQPRAQTLEATNAGELAATDAGQSPSDAGQSSSDAPEQPPPGDPRIARLFEMTSDLLAAISLDGHFTLLNPAWEHLLGWSLEELTEQPMHERVHPDDIEQTLALTQAGRNRSAQLVNFTNRYRHKDGS